MLKISKMTSTKRYVVTLNDHYTLRIQYSRTNTFKDTLGIEYFRMEALLEINSKCTFRLSALYTSNKFLKMEADYLEPGNKDIYLSEQKTCIVVSESEAMNTFNHYIDYISLNTINDMLKTRKTLNGNPLVTL